MLPFGLGTTELIIVLVVAIVIFGPKRIPGIGRSLGKASREFRDGISEIEEVRRGTVGQIDDLKDSFKVDVNPLSARARPPSSSVRRTKESAEPDEATQAKAPKADDADPRTPTA